MRESFPSNGAGSFHLAGGNCEADGVFTAGLADEHHRYGSLTHGGEQPAGDADHPAHACTFHIYQGYIVDNGKSFYLIQLFRLSILADAGSFILLITPPTQMDIDRFVDGGKQGLRMDDRGTEEGELGRLGV